ncbi:unnamed protein product [Effrenium voratum]|uniref:Sodium/calcium exchanger membrane region domain-containing protein n=1 Tax=Effrenium voratum TaxID=2562239 RepID=A0AA36JEY7_9DINO|nr:unnamed protein product [Effrenium voratum]CAJ1404972.1 unnamed protein product [Effrenium voratum]
MASGQMVPSDRTFAPTNGQYAAEYAYHSVPANPGDSVAVAVEQDASQVPQGRAVGDCQALCSMLCNWTNLLLVCVPLGFISHLRDWGCLAVFSLNFLAIVPLVHTGQMIGGLLNATFGNAVEMIVTVNAIKAGLVTVVQGSLIGSVLSNLLLVLGMAFFASGVVRKENCFNEMGASANVICLALGSVALALPTVFNGLENTSKQDVLAVSRASSGVVAAIYVCFLVFQLGTHSDMFLGGEDEEEEVTLSALCALLVLIGATVAVAACSELLVDSIEGVTEDYGLPEAFIGVILLPIVGNAAEHATAVTVAIKGKMDLSLGVAVGSSTQIALLVVPFSVFVGWAYDVPMSLDFRRFDTSVLLLSVLMVSLVLRDGSSNWLQGAILMAIYLLVAILCWYIPPREEAG